jgi:hypothetical protein
LPVAALHPGDANGDGVVTAAFGEDKFKKYN